MESPEKNLITVDNLPDFQIEPIDNLDFNDNGLKKLELDPAQKASMSFFVSQMPTLMSSSALSQMYTVRFPEGLPHTLMQYKSGGVGSPIHGEHGIVGHASFHKATLQAVALSAFSVMSVATGRYFLTQINNEFKMLNQKIDKVLDFLYGDKKAELMSEISFVQYAQKNYRSIMAHTTQQLATVSGLQQAKKVAMKDIEFYLGDLVSKVNSTKLFKTAKDIETALAESLRLRDSLELAMQLYVMGGLMESLYSQNSDSDYLAYIKNDMIYYVNKCDRQILSCFSALSAQNHSENKIPIGKKSDTANLENRLKSIIDSLNVGSDTPMIQTIRSSIDALSSNGEYYLTKNGDVYLRTTVS